MIFFLLHVIDNQSFEPGCETVMFFHVSHILLIIYHVTIQILQAFCSTQHSKVPSMKYKTTYIPVIKYGCKSWPLPSDRNSQLQATEMRYLRKNEGKTKKERITNQTISVEFGIIPLKKVMELAQYRWFGYVIRMGDKRYSKMAWQATVQRKRLKGSPQQTCEGGIQKVLVERGIKWNRLRATA